MCSHSHSHGVVLPPSLPTHCSERTCAPTHTPMVSYYHQVYSHTHFSHTHSPIHVIPVNTPMVSYYHQVYPLTALRELVLPLTLPWCRTTTKCTLTLSSLSPHFSECSHPSLVFSHSPSHIECHHTHSHILLTCVTTLSDLTSLVF